MADIALPAGRSRVSFHFCSVFVVFGEALVTRGGFLTRYTWRPSDWIQAILPPLRQPFGNNLLVSGLRGKITKHAQIANRLAAWATVWQYSTVRQQTFMSHDFQIPRNGNRNSVDGSMAVRWSDVNGSSSGSSTVRCGTKDVRVELVTPLICEMLS